MPLFIHPGERRLVREYVYVAHSLPLFLFILDLCLSVQHTNHLLIYLTLSSFFLLSLCLYLSLSPLLSLHCSLSIALSTSLSLYLSLSQFLLLLLSPFLSLSLSLSHFHSPSLTLLSLSLSLSLPLPLSVFLDLILGSFPTKKRWIPIIPAMYDAQLQTTTKVLH